MKDHFVKMDIEQAQMFQHDVLSIVKAIPSGRVTPTVILPRWQDTRAMRGW